MTEIDTSSGTLEQTALSPDVLVVAAHGPLDARIAGPLRDALVPAAAEDGTVVVLDLADVQAVDEDAFAAVAHAAHVASKRGTPLAIVTTSRAVVDLVAETGLDDIVTIHPSLGDAIRK